MEKRLLPRAAGPSTLSTSSTVKKSENIKNYLTMESMESMEKRFFKANGPLHALHGKKFLKKIINHGGHGGPWRKDFLRPTPPSTCPACPVNLLPVYWG